MGRIPQVSRAWWVRRIFPQVVQSHKRYYESPFNDGKTPYDHKWKELAGL